MLDALPYVSACEMPKLPYLCFERYLIVRGSCVDLSRIDVDFDVSVNSVAAPKVLQDPLKCSNSLAVAS